MKYTYQHLDWRELANQQARGRQMDELFRELMLRLNGDVEAALGQLDRMAERFRETVGFSPAEFDERLRRHGLIAGDPGARKLTHAGEQHLRQGSFDAVFGNLKPSAHGGHATRKPGITGEPTGLQRPWQAGDDSRDIAYRESLVNRLRAGRDTLEPADLVVDEREANTSVATVMCLDVSHSMTLYGEDRITPAKRVALAFAELQQRHHPRDSFNVLLFGDDVREVTVAELPYITNGPFHTNTAEVLRRAAEILSKRHQPNKRVVLITDGKPTALFTAKGLMINSSSGLDPQIVTATLNQAARYPRQGIELNVFMVATDPYLERFVDRLCEVSRGQAFRATLDNLGQQVLAHLGRRRR